MVTRFFDHPDLVRHLGAAQDRDEGPRRDSCRARPRYSSSFAIRKPAADTGTYLVTPTVEAWARWAVPKASFTKTSQSLGEGPAHGLVVLLVPGVEAAVLQHEDLAWPKRRRGGLAASPMQSGAMATGVPSSSDRRGHGRQAQRGDHLALWAGPGATARGPSPPCPARTGWSAGPPGYGCRP